MATTYKVQKGDTLSSIAKKTGVGIDQISGYRSGNKDLIYEGEELALGGSPKSEASSYVSEVKDQLGDTGGSSSKSTSIYDSEKLKTDRDTYKSGLDSAYKKLKDVQQETFDTEYEKRGLDKKKEKMSELDSQIATERAKRDEAINKIRTNPGLSAAQMTGDIKKAADYQNSVINNLIQERNGVAGEYNAALDEIDGAVSRAASGAQAEYNYYSGLLGNTEGTLKEYQSSLVDQLRADTQADQFDRQLAQALEIATMKANDSGGSGSKLQLRSDPNTGDPLYWFDPDTGAITYIDEGDEGGGNSGGGSSFDDIGTDEAADASSSKPWYSRLWGAITGR